MRKGTDLETLSDDGLFTPEVGEWSERKYLLLTNYLEIFTRAMADKWGRLVYVDLFAGSGRALLRDSQRIVRSSPMIAMNTTRPFGRYIFCENDGEQVSALQRRVEKHSGHNEVSYFLGDCNEMAERIYSQASMKPKSGSTLGFCLVDPFKASSLKFETLRLLANMKIDFMTLIPTDMDIRRNAHNYTRSTDRTVDDFVGHTEWRKRWPHAEVDGADFGSFVTGEFCDSMKALGYQEVGREDLEPVRNDEMNRTMYLLTLFSKDKTGKKFWSEAIKSSSLQRTLW